MLPLQARCEVSRAAGGDGGLEAEEELRSPGGGGEEAGAVGAEELGGKQSGDAAPGPPGRDHAPGPPVRLRPQQRQVALQRVQRIPQPEGRETKTVRFAVVHLQEFYVI